MATRAREPSARGAAAIAVIFAFALLVVVSFLGTERESWNTRAAVFVLPVVFFGSLPAFARQARREGQPRLFTFLILALSVKLLFSFFRWYHAFYVVNGADAVGYDREGWEIASRFLRGDFTMGLEGIYDTNFIRLLTGSIYTVIHPTSLGGFLIYAWLAFWGTYLFYRAFVIAVPQGNRRSYARWLFFMPSILFWPSSIGKESWLIFGLGIAAFGAARLLTGRFVPGLVITGIGLALTSMVRAPIAVVFGVALIVAGIVRRQRREGQRMPFLARLATIAVFALAGLVLYTVMQGFLVRSGFASTGVEGAVVQAGRVTDTGGSEFDPVAVTSPVGLAVASVTVLFRPFPFEANNAEALVTSIEAVVLMLLSIVRYRSILAALRAFRRVPYTLVAFLYVGGSILALAPVANFGIIARQRVLIFPMWLVLVCFLAREPAAPSRARSAVRYDRAAPSLVGSRT